MKRLTGNSRPKNSITQRKKDAQKDMQNEYGWFFGRKEAAILAQVCERTIYNQGRERKIRTKRNGAWLKYEVKQCPQARAAAVLPLGKFDLSNTFVVWLTFTEDACRNNRDSIDNWSQSLKRMVEDYVKQQITREDVKENEMIRRMSTKLLAEERYFCPNRKISDQVNGSDKR